MQTEAKELIQRLKQTAYDGGFSEGWNAAVERMNEVVNKLPGPSKSNPFRRGTGQAKVYDYIRENPGKKSKDISAGTGVTCKIVSNTVYRLKGKAINDDGWRLI